MERHGQSQRQNGRQRRGQQPAPSSSGGDAQQMYAFAGAQYPSDTAIPSTSIPYGQDQAPGAPAPQTQQYSQYASNLMYNMPGQTQTAQFDMPGAAQYYMAGQPGSQVPELPSQGMPAQYATPATHPEASGSIAQAFPMDPSQSSAFATYVQQAQQYQTPQQQPIPSNAPAFDTYQAQLRQIFTLARDGSLQDIGARLLDASQYLLGNVEVLGLTRDEETLHDERVRLWDEFNKAWLVALQRQLDLTQQAMQGSRRLPAGQSIMSAQTLDRLSSELVRLCDNVERHGLVDYQMGVAEEEIMDLLLRCLALLNSSRGEGGASQAESSTAGAARRRRGG